MCWLGVQMRASVLGRAPGAGFPLEHVCLPALRPQMVPLHGVWKARWRLPPGTLRRDIFWGLFPLLGVAPGMRPPVGKEGLREGLRFEEADGRAPVKWSKGKEDASEWL